MVFWRLLHYFFLARAVSRGPSALLRYEVRRQGRRALYRATRARRQHR